MTDNGCTFTQERTAAAVPSTSTYRKHRKERHGWLNFEGIEFHAFVGNMFRVANYRGDHFLVDRWGGVWKMVGENGIEIVTLNDRGTHKRNGYARGLDVIIDWSFQEPKYDDLATFAKRNY